ncbi:hypothetical protein WA158_001453 [Blastocystis sp. Blastoise]
MSLPSQSHKRVHNHENTYSSTLNFFIDSQNGMNGKYEISQLKERLRKLNITVSDIYVKSVNIFVPLSKDTKGPQILNTRRSRLSKIVMNESLETSKDIKYHEKLYRYSIKHRISMINLSRLIHFITKSESQKLLLEKENRKIIKLNKLDGFLSSSTTTPPPNCIYIRDLSKHNHDLIYTYKNKIPAYPSLTQLPLYVSPLVPPEHWANRVLAKNRYKVNKQFDKQRNRKPRLCNICNIVYTNYDEHIQTQTHQEIDKEEETWMEFISFVDKQVYQNPLTSQKTKTDRYIMWLDNDIQNYLINDNNQSNTLSSLLSTDHNASSTFIEPISPNDFSNTQLETKHQILPLPDSIDYNTDSESRTIDEEDE